jgi:hypothetical protein
MLHVTASFCRCVTVSVTAYGRTRTLVRRYCIALPHLNPEIITSLPLPIRVQSDASMTLVRGPECHLLKQNSRHLDIGTIRIRMFCWNLHLASHPCDMKVMFSQDHKTRVDVDVEFCYVTYVSTVLLAGQREACLLPFEHTSPW